VLSHLHSTVCSHPHNKYSLLLLYWYTLVTIKLIKLLWALNLNLWNGGHHRHSAVIVTLCLGEVQSLEIFVSACGYVCPLIYLKNCMSRLHELSVCYLWPWLSSRLATVHYVLHVFWTCLPTSQLVTPRSSNCTCLLRALWRHYALFASTASVVGECICHHDG